MSSLSGCAPAPRSRDTGTSLQSRTLAGALLSLGIASTVMSEISDFNAKVIDEFRANGGRLGGPFEEMPVLLAHHKGRRSGTERVSPLGYQKVDGGWAVFGSFRGAPRHPDWYLNLVAEPHT